MRRGPVRRRGPLRRAGRLTPGAAVLAALATLLLTVAPGVSGALGAVAPAPVAASAGPARWAITSDAAPTYFKPASTGDEYLVTATNVGGAPTSGPITISDTLSGEAKATKIVGATNSEEGIYGDAFTKNPLECTLSAPSSVSCGYNGSVDPGDTLTFEIKVDVSANEGARVTNSAAVSGGGVASASTSEPTTVPTPVSTAPVPFGVSSYFAALSTQQAGAHPDFTTSFVTNWAEVKNGVPLPAGAPHEIDVDLPPGLTGNPLSVPRCNIDSVRREQCPEDAAVGIAIARTQGGNVFTQLVYSVTPYAEEPAAFAFTVDRGIATVRLDTSLGLNPQGEYAVHVAVTDVNESEAILSSSVTLWGAPSQHNGPGPDTSTECAKEPCLTFGGPGDQAGLEEAFVRNPTSCSGAPSVALKMDSWQQIGVFPPVEPSRLPAPSECPLASPIFTPSLQAAPTSVQAAPETSTQIAPNTFQAGAPAGYTVNLGMPPLPPAQDLSTPDLRDATVTLPLGTVASPSAANGLQACTDTALEAASLEPAHCPPASRIGRVEIETPLLLAPLKGEVFLGQPECSPCNESDAAEGRMLRLFIQAQGSGVRIKLTGRTKVDQGSGQLTTVFQATPQQPFERLTLSTEGGRLAPLANPTACGTATTISQLVPWSSTPAAPFAAEPSSSFQVGGCASQFAPALTAGMTGSDQAGSYSPFSLTVSRTDADQQLAAIKVETPPGLLGMVSHVVQCGEPEAEDGGCGPESQIGTVTVAAGPGKDPFWISGGRVYLTGPYKDAPFGLSIVVPAVAGPFNLGEERVRAAIYVDPKTSALRVVSDLPTKRDGIPFQLKTIEVNVDRPQFMFNATNCDPLAIGATLAPAGGPPAAPSSVYQVHGCALLPFKPSFSVSTQGQTSKANGASLDVKVSERQGEANVRRVDVSLPRALPSRLSTLQKACPEPQFALNPAGCPEGSNVGIATARTPVLNAPLTGPAYLVSHGGAEFPDLDVVLQGERVTIVLTGNTDIKNGVTYSKFEAVPDAPINEFELNLPEGPHSALGAFGNLCAQTKSVKVRKRVAVRRLHRTVYVMRTIAKKVPVPLSMPTTIVGQNGAVVKQSTQIAVAGCAKRTTAKARRPGSSGKTGRRHPR